MTPVRILAPAKVNLHLRILGRRPDGYHDLETLFQAADLCDALEIERAGSAVELTVEGEDVGPAADNLVSRAARAFLSAAGRSGDGVRIRLEKRIPAGAGLGGGSSDAAATLLALDAVFPGEVAPERARALAAELGSDVPFFLGASPLALGRGRGEMLEGLPTLPPVPVVIVLPAVRVATADAYRALARGREGRAVPEAGLRAPTSWDGLARTALNDFEPVVAELHGAVREALAALRATDPTLALLSGSGSSAFGLYASEEAAARAVAHLSERTDLRVFPTCTLERWPARP